MPGASLLLSFGGLLRVRIEAKAADANMSDLLALLQGSMNRRSTQSVEAGGWFDIGCSCKPKEVFSLFAEPCVCDIDHDCRGPCSARRSVPAGHARQGRVVCLARPLTGRRGGVRPLGDPVAARCAHCSLYVACQASSAHVSGGSATDAATGLSQPSRQRCFYGAAVLGEARAGVLCFELKTCSLEDPAFKKSCRRAAMGVDDSVLAHSAAKAGPPRVQRQELDQLVTTRTAFDCWSKASVGFKFVTRLTTTGFGQMAIETLQSSPARPRARPSHCGAFRVQRMGARAARLR